MTQAQVIHLLGESFDEMMSQPEVECSNCSSRFREPRLLNCLHAYCILCIQDMQKQQGERSAGIVCPLCGQGTRLEGQAPVAALPRYFALSALVEEVTIMEQLRGDQGSEIKCQACEEGNDAVSRCTDCANFLCQECQKAHERLAVMKSHRIYTLDELRSGKVAYRSKSREHVPKCGRHPDQNLSIYCDRCEQLTCTTCSVLHHGGPKHSLIELLEAFEKCKQVIETLAAKATDKKTEMAAVISQTDASRKKLDTMFSDTNRKITVRADEEVARIRGEEVKLKHEAEVIYKFRVQTFESALAAQSKEASQAQHKLDGINTFCSQANCYEVLELRQKIVENLRQLTKEQPRNVMPTRLSYIDFEEDGIGSLGRLVLEEKPQVQSEVSAARIPRSGKWVLKEDMKTFGQDVTTFKGVYDVAVFSNNEIVMADTNLKVLLRLPPQSKPPSSRSPKAIPERIPISNLTNPSRVSVSKDDRLLVLDGPTVRVFDRRYQPLRHFTPGGGPTGPPACLAVDDRNRIAIGYHHKAEITLHNFDGSLIRTLPAPFIDYYLTAYKQQFVYTNVKHRKILSVDHDGGMIFSVDTNSSVRSKWRPVSICEGSNDGIYIAGSGGILSSFGEIHHFSPQGEYLGPIMTDCGSSPCGITATPNGELVVAGGHSVKIYHQV